ncbi:hypothetical protein DEO23_12560 [Brachybacterium endophyticum]|uniref:MNN4 protein n=1 Tax=Brachybacterium endophyticum TaxID=2182385 RepID=A0A2U2RHR1_9MICO|nr:hypothetical protein [Brachybacterium endophyticum]PWH05409.1 hypothetical protein DEO23_12560 [Brachybacterium endophyticum]
MSSTLASPDAPQTDGAGGADEVERPLEAPEPRRPQDYGLDTALLRRIRLIAFAIVGIPLLVLALLAVRFVTMPLTQAWHGAAYGDGKYPQAIERLWPVQNGNWFEPYLPHLSKGTDLLQDGKDAEAETELRTALKEWEGHIDINAPQHAQCKILNNLAISIERQANQIEDAGDRADRLHEAEQVLEPCAGGGGGGEGEGQGGGGQGEGQGGEGSGNEDSGTTKGNGERVEKERKEADKEAGNDPDAREKGEEKGGSGDQEKGDGGAMDPGEPKKDDPEGKGPDEEKPTQGDSEDQKKSEDLDERNKDANSGDGEDSQDGDSSDPSQPW